MKKIYILIVSLFLISCEYQDGSFLKGNALDGFTQTVESDIQINNAQWLEGYKLTNSISFTDNVDSYIKKYIHLLPGDYDTLVNYDELYNDRSSPKTLELRSNVYKQIFEFTTDGKSRDEISAFYINAYNFLVIETVVKYLYNSEGEKLKSILDVYGATSFEVFDAETFLVNKQSVSLNFLEKTWLLQHVTDANGSVDARIHFAVICGAKGCPILLTEAFRASKLEEQLNFITTKGLSLARNYRFEDGKTKLTQLFNWYKSDFINHRLENNAMANSIAGFIKHFIPSATVNDTIEHVHYDWALNIKE